MLFLLYLVVRVLARLHVTSGLDDGSKNLEILVPAMASSPCSMARRERPVARPR